MNEQDEDHEHLPPAIKRESGYTKNNVIVKISTFNEILSSYPNSTMSKIKTLDENKGLKHFPLQNLHGEKRGKQMKKDKMEKHRNVLEQMPRGYRDTVRGIMAMYKSDFFNAEGILKDQILERGGI